MTAPLEFGQNDILQQYALDWLERNQFKFGYCWTTVMDMGSYWLPSYMLL